MIEESIHDHTDRGVLALDRDESLRLLAEAPMGRVVFTRNALPAIRPVNHLVQDGVVVVRTRVAARLSTAVRADSGVVVAYQADEIDAVRRIGWSVVVTGIARTITDPERVAKYEQLLRPWVGNVMDTVIEIEPTLVTGIRLIEKER